MSTEIAVAALFQSLIELHQDTIRVSEEHRADTAAAILEGIRRSTSLRPLRQEALRQGIDIGNGKGQMTNPHLIEHDRLATDSIPWVLGHDQHGNARPGAGMEVDHPPLCMSIAVQVGEAAATRVLQGIFLDTETQQIAVKLQRSIDITHADGDMRHAGNRAFVCHGHIPPRTFFRMVSQADAQDHTRRRWCTLT